MSMSEKNKQSGYYQVFGCGPSSDQCTCQCPDGPCEHKWDGPVHNEPQMSTATCSKCGELAINHDLWVMP